MVAKSLRLMAPRDITAVLHTIGVHPPVTPEMLDRPTQDVVLSALVSLSEFAYDMDIQTLKSQIPPDFQSAERNLSAAVELVAVLGLTRQLAVINGIDDFCLKDVWEPHPKRLRSLLSGIINFCRYKENQFIRISEMKEDEQTLFAERAELDERIGILEEELDHAQAQHDEEQPQMWAGEAEVREVRALVDRLQKQAQQTAHVQETAESELTQLQRASAEDHRKEHLVQQVSALRDQIAESPEGLEREIQDLHTQISQQKARLEEKVEEKKNFGRRVQLLAGLVGHTEKYGDEFDKAARAKARVYAAQEQNQSARDDLASLERSLEVRRGEEIELEQAVRRVDNDIERAKCLHEERVQQLEARRQHALQKQQEAHAQRTNDQKKVRALTLQRSELECKAKSLRNAHEVEMAGLREVQRTQFAEVEDYMQRMHMLLLADERDGRPVTPGKPCAQSVRSSLNQTPRRSRRPLSNAA